MLERNLGVRLFHRSTRKLTLTEAGERFLQEIGNNLEGLQNAIAAMATDKGEPAGLLKVSMGLSFGVNYILPLLPEFLGRYPRIRPDWQFDNRRVDLIAEGFDAAIGGGFDLAPAVISRVLAPLQIIAVGSPDYMKGRTPPIDPTGLSEFDGIVLRSSLTGRLRHRVMRNAIGAELPAALNETIVVNDPAAMSQAAVLSLGVALISVPEALPYLESNALVRLVPSWYADLGPISLYFATRALLPAKTRVFVDFVLEAFGGIVWPNASREVSDRTRPIVLASLIAPQRNCDGDMGADIKLNQLGLNQDNMRLEVRHATRTHPFSVAL
jgi:DNA-binding transcriptional LysR family regulator